MIKAQHPIVKMQKLSYIGSPYLIQELKCILQHVFRKINDLFEGHGDGERRKALPPAVLVFVEVEMSRAELAESRRWTLHLELPPDWQRLKVIVWCLDGHINKKPDEMQSSQDSNFINTM